MRFNGTCISSRIRRLPLPPPASVMNDVFYAQKKQIAIEKGRDGGEQKMLEYVTSLFTRIQENVE